MMIDVLDWQKSNIKHIKYYYFIIFLHFYIFNIVQHFFTKTLFTHFVFLNFFFIEKRNEKSLKKEGPEKLLKKETIEKRNGLQGHFLPRCVLFTSTKTDIKHEKKG